MTTVNKIRIATPDSDDALGNVKVEVERATGFGAQLEFQEIDRTELVVELRLVDWNAVRPDLVARAVERSTRDLEVLSSWKEDPLVCDPTRPRQTLVNADDHPMPALARRALRDGLPTAQWLSIDGDDPIGPGPRQWHLAVPMVRSDGQSVVGLRHRPGYSLRFNPLDAIAARVDLAPCPPQGPAMLLGGDTRRRPIGLR